MLVKHIYIAKEKLTLLNIDDSVERAMQLIDEHQLLSLPVIEGGKFVGVLSKKYLLEEFYKENIAKKDFLKLPISQFMKTKLPTVQLSDIIEIPAQILLEKQLQFVPVLDSRGNFAGIVSHKAIFSMLTKILGFNETRLAVTTFDSRGTLAKLASIVAKKGGNIVNIANVDIELMNLREIILRVQIDDPNGLINELNAKGFRVRHVN